MSAVTTTPCSATIEVLEFFKIAVLEAGTTAYLASLTAHGMAVNDFIVNITKAAAPSRKFFPRDLPEYSAGRRKIDEVPDANWFLHSYYTIYDPDGAYQGPGDLVALYKFQDKTSYLLDGSISGILTAQQESDNITFTMKHDFSKHVNVYIADSVDYFETSPLNFMFNWSDKTWSNKTAYNYPRKGANAEKVVDNFVFWGATATKYDISADSWSDLSSPTDARANAFSAEIDNVIYLYGGQGPSGGPIEKYTPGSDTWAALTAHGTDYYDGCGMNVCNTLFCNYMATSTTTFETTDIIYIPLQDVWANYPVNNTAPSRNKARSGYSIDCFKAQVVGGTDSGYYSGSITNNTSANLICKVYSEKTEIPTAVSYSANIACDKFAIHGGGYNTSSTMVDKSYYFSDVRESWTALDDLPEASAAGMGV